jgi:hypothetical protein
MVLLSRCLFGGTIYCVVAVLLRHVPATVNGERDSALIGYFCACIGDRCMCYCVCHRSMNNKGKMAEEQDI